MYCVATHNYASVAHAHAHTHTHVHVHVYVDMAHLLPSSSSNQHAPLNWPGIKAWMEKASAL